jgi:hypothetical protein
VVIFAEIYRGINVNKDEVDCVLTVKFRTNLFKAKFKLYSEYDDKCNLHVRYVRRIDPRSSDI